MKILWLSKIETNKNWGCERFYKTAFENKNIFTVDVDYQVNRGVLLKAVPNGYYDGTIIQRGTGYILPKYVIKKLPRPRVLLFTELVIRHPNQHYLFDEDLFDFFLIRGTNCLKILTGKFNIDISKIQIHLSAATPFKGNTVYKERNMKPVFIGSLTPRRKNMLSGMESNIDVLSLFGDEMLEELRRRQFVLNIHAEDYIDTETRVFEVFSAGSTLITEQLGLECPFIKNKDYIVFNNKEQLKEIINDLKTISPKQYKNQILVDHNYHNRVEQIIKIIRSEGFFRKNEFKNPFFSEFIEWFLLKFKSIKQKIKT